MTKSGPKEIVNSKGETIVLDETMAEVYKNFTEQMKMNETYIAEKLKHLSENREMHIGSMDRMFAQHGRVRAAKRVINGIESGRLTLQQIRGVFQKELNRDAMDGVRTAEVSGTLERTKNMAGLAEALEALDSYI